MCSFEIIVKVDFGFSKKWFVNGLNVDNYPLTLSLGLNIFYFHLFDQIIATKPHVFIPKFKVFNHVITSKV